MGDFFNNASVAAFLGALSAVFVVLATDRLRDRRNVETIRGEIETAQGHAKQKLDTVRSVLSLFREKRLFRSGEIMKFDVGVVRELKARVLHLLEPRQRQALDAVLFRMEGVDALLDRVHHQQEEFRPKPGWQVQVAPAPNQLEQHDTLLADVITNLKMLIEMAGKYSSGDYAGITQKQYLPADYADPAPAPPDPGRA